MQRVIPFYKCLAFFLLTWIVSGSLFPEHPRIEVMMRNASMAMNASFAVSGVLTHLTYHETFSEIAHGVIISRLFRDRRFYAATLPYLHLRITVFLPIILIALLWMFILALVKGGNPFLDLMTCVVTFTGLAPFLTFHPANFGIPLTYLTFDSVPMALAATSLAICWLAYPFIAVMLRIALTFRPQAKLVNLLTLTIVFCLLSPILTGLLATMTSLVPSLQLSEGHQIYRDNLTLAGSSLWFINPIFKLPVFIGGMVIGEWILHLRWNEFEVEGFVQEYILPYIADLALVAGALLISHDPRLSSIASMKSWVFFVSFGFLPLAYLTLLLMANPNTKKSLTHIILCQDPVMAVLPGRSSVIMSLTYALVYRTFSTAAQNDIAQGAGVVLVVFCFFVTAVPLYYYAFQPWHLWVYFKVHPYVTDEADIADTPTTIDDDDIKKDVVFASPHYDPFYPDNPKQESKVYAHVSSIDIPSINVQSLLNFFRLLFIDTQYVE